MSDGAFYVRVPRWLKEYGAGGVSDERAVQDFMECETLEAVRALQNELIALSQGRYTDEYLDKIVGAARRDRHGTYATWAKSVLVRIASHRT